MLPSDIPIADVLFVTSNGDIAIKKIRNGNNVARTIKKSFNNGDILKNPLAKKENPLPLLLFLFCLPFKLDIPLASSSFSPSSSGSSLSKRLLLRDKREGLPKPLLSLGIVPLLRRLPLSAPPFPLPGGNCGPLLALILFKALLALLLKSASFLAWPTPGIKLVALFLRSSLNDELGFLFKLS